MGTCDRNGKPIIIGDRVTYNGHTVDVTGIAEHAFRASLCERVEKDTPLDKDAPATKAAGDTGDTVIWGN